jgi:hypothetical protein
MNDIGNGATSSPMGGDFGMRAFSDASILSRTSVHTVHLVTGETIRSLSHSLNRKKTCSVALSPALACLNFSFHHSTIMISTLVLLELSNARPLLSGTRSYLT